MWENIVERGRAHGACALHARYLRLQTHSEYVIFLFNYTNGCTNAPQSYVTCTMYKEQCTMSVKEQCTMTVKEQCTMSVKEQCTMTVKEQCTMSVKEQCTMSVKEQCTYNITSSGVRTTTDTVEKQ